MSKAYRKWKEKYHGSMREYRRERRFMQQWDKEAEKCFTELHNFHKFFYISHPEYANDRNRYNYSPEFWDWVYKNVKRYEGRVL